ncbi:MAG: pilus assembly protein N-terminal domain-containing protein [Reyranella sp.]|uniref:type II and III secretion system protein family protein n=1 Tax=Reyranella sp. TaxID=1929291 RepID=UPI00272F3F53|nr:pilus assembly protein N-terminal domain-containing protein [Reyranella sp.]MDP1964194.1 pilus assembly protein N-terminal domain-containing protein [Reyranella sp.]MDP2373709.1 pilus assembly protein N-terminal domain-containing protein [Reyranella sp.]
MTLSFALATKPSIWRRAGSPLALIAALSFALQPTLSLAQSIEPDSPAKIQTKAKNPNANGTAKKTKSRTSPTDNVSEDLNRRESERVELMMRTMASPPAASVPVAAAASAAVPTTVMPTVAAIPARAPVVSASLTPAVGMPQAMPAMSVPPVAATPAGDRSADQFAQAQSQTQSQVTPSRPAPLLAQTTPPVPIPPATTPRTPQVVGGAPSRAFGQSQVVPTQPPTLTLEINKGTAIKLPGPAATVFVAAPDIADVQVRSPTMVYVFAKKPGDTVLYAVDDQDRVLLNTIVSVTSPISRMKGALDALHPANGISYDNQGETIVMTGTVRSAVVAEDARRLALQHVNGNAAKVISNVKVDAPTQVQLRVRVAEVRRDALKRVGINWQNINNIALFGLSTLGIAAGTGAAVRTIQNTGGVASGAIAFQTNDGGLNGIVDFLATQNQATILAEPNLIALSGETASFLAGGEIPIITPQGGTTNATITVAYKQVGVSLAFTPTIIGDRINLKVAPEVSQLSTIGSINVPLTATAVVTVPGIQTRKASTTIELGSGQSFAIAGLLQASSQQDIVKLPWLGDIPILGSLFKSDAFQRSETELVIIITPYFVEPTSAKLRTPLTDRVPPTDADRLIYQRLNHPTPPRRVAVGREQYSGPSAGFKLE